LAKYIVISKPKRTSIATGVSHFIGITLGCVVVAEQKAQHTLYGTTRLTYDSSYIFSQDFTSSFSVPCLAFWVTLHLSDIPAIDSGAFR